jgi:LytS/YehU family sensor histidine kinase
VVVLLNPWAGWYDTVPSFDEVLLTSVANNFFLYCMLVGIGHAVVYSRRIRERDEQLARAELHALKLQLHPHFLFNTLNTISTYVRSDQDVARRMISRLSDLLRRVLENEGVEEVSLQEELDLVSAYLDIEQARFDDRLHVEWQIEPATLGARVPHLMLQPLVENAIRHGIAPRSAKGTLRISSRRENGTLSLAVRDDGMGSTVQSPAYGRGLSNTRNRLLQLYGNRQSMQVTAPAAGGFTVELTMPFRTRASVAG